MVMVCINRAGKLFLHNQLDQNMTQFCFWIAWLNVSRYLQK